MAQRLATPAPGGGTTDHSEEVRGLRNRALLDDDRGQRLTLATAADLLEMHDHTGISLDRWPAARALVEALIGGPIIENNV